MVHLHLSCSSTCVLVTENSRRKKNLADRSTKLLFISTCLTKNTYCSVFQFFTRYGGEEGSPSEVNTSWIQPSNQINKSHLLLFLKMSKNFSSFYFSGLRLTAQVYVMISSKVGKDFFSSPQIAYPQIIELIPQLQIRTFLRCVRSRKQITHKICNFCMIIPQLSKP